MKKNRFFWIAALVGLLLDRVTKYWVVQSFEDLGDTVPLWEGVFHFTYVVNTGAAFSLFEETGGWLRWLSLAVSLGLIALAWFGPRLKITEQLGYGLILAGALGNGIDRFLFGYVVDFLDFRLIQFPVFNVADVCINVGIVFLLISSLGGGGESARTR
ncbi:MAG: signal peptidase II [Cyanobacteria bacterium QH_8_48_120]|jgi:signal peptidase II|nr:MAG: signal peptidase II [Cyanobacteria bacterium QH_1_48_107]PSO59229.1 MAG: signal peptidase II [Cyanobacteria bacterium QH_2_48_84]PSO60541.1 MAG: signal peptidase II [Cyanobacteria bacterium QH_10_48_56]PSO61844.1 MAG: signal peptidase II [Cyanobacteria bacterium QH_7_48_89]PSO63303.1 MAG: signal peptidase II [Cyanobacteria bacterium QH_6_48_35]PSO71192.1 MAG: signal peptidase II [Cyanobacteria bacterium QS_1_48_34]PSO72520.1 MAG: signal peptidase II [Cyanobacteria bacterium QH_3_48_40